MESGGTRNYEVYKDKEKTEGEAVIEKEEEEKIDPMKALENRVLDSQREMADLDNLEEIRAMNRRHVKLLSNSGEGFDADAKAVMKAREAREKLVENIELNEHGITEEEENLIKNIKFGQAASAVKRLNEEDEMLEEKRRQREGELMQRNPTNPVVRKTAIPKIKVKRKKKVEAAVTAKKAKTETVSAMKPAAAPSSGGFAGLLGDYGSDSD
jgi:hypothetical protein